MKANLDETIQKIEKHLKKMQKKEPGLRLESMGQHIDLIVDGDDDFSKSPIVEIVEISMFCADKKLAKEFAKLFKILLETSSEGVKS